MFFIWRAFILYFHFNFFHNFRQKNSSFKRASVSDLTVHLMFSATPQYFVSLTNTSVHPAFKKHGDFRTQVYDRILLP